MPTCTPSRPRLLRARLALLLLGLCAASPALADTVTPNGVYGTAHEVCIDAGGAVVSDTTVSWTMGWRMNEWDSLGGLSQNNALGHQHQWAYASIQAEWTFGDVRYELFDGEISTFVSTYESSPGDRLEFEHVDEALGDAVVNAGWLVTGDDFDGTIGWAGDDASRTWLDPDTVTSATMSFAIASADGSSCTWTGDIEGYVPEEICTGGVDEDGDGLIDGDDPYCQFCGDGIVDVDEECDDGARESFDGCDAYCMLEPDSDGDGVSDTFDRCDGEDDTIDEDGDWWPDCLPRVYGGDAGGTAEYLCYDEDPWVPRVVETAPWTAVWDISTGVRDTYGSREDGSEILGQFSGIDAVWTIGETVYEFTEAELYVQECCGPDFPSDTFYLEHREPGPDGNTVSGHVEIWDGSFLYGDITNGTVGIDLDGVDSMRMQFYPDQPSWVCYWEGTIEYFGGDPGADGDYVPDDVDACPLEDATGWDVDGDGCIDDTDGDTVGDNVDLCPTGDDRIDDDGDGTPDACDICPGDPANDQDGDGLCTADDPCPFDADTAVSDSDVDGDGVCNHDDLCSAESAGWLGGSEDDLIDTDADGIPDGCDLCVDLDADGACTSDELCYRTGMLGDADVDGVCDTEDVCPLDYLDDSDGDGLCDSDDQCPGLDDGVDTDGDTLPDCLDACPVDPENDGDGDGICEATDNCPLVPNANQADGDGDGLGDACETDADDDGVLDDVDNCPLDANPDQADTDGDGDGDACDACDADADGDGVGDAEDTCVAPADGEPVLDSGCTVTQTCPEDGDWKNNGACLRCTGDAADELLDAGLITHEEWVAYTVAAAQAHGNKK